MSGTWRSQGATISTAQSKFGGASALVASSNGLFNFWKTRAPLTGDFTFEGWVRFNSFTGSIINIFSTNIGYADTSSSNSLALVANSTQFSLWLGGALNGSSVNHGMVINTWYHIALVRTGTSILIFRDGTLLRTTTYSSAISLDRGIGVGSKESTSTSIANIDGYVDEYRFTRDFARYTAAFTAPAAAFDLGTDPQAANVVALLHCNGTNGSTTFTDEVSASGFSGTKSNKISIPIFKVAGTSTNLGKVVRRRGIFIRPRKINIYYGDNVYTVLNDISNQSYFIEGTTVKDSLPLGGVKVYLRATNLIGADFTITGSDGKFLFMDLTYMNGKYQAIGVPPANISHNSIVWDRLEPIPYNITTTGSFVQNTGTGLVESSVQIVSGLSPFTATLVNGALPPGTTLTVSDRNLLLTGSTTFTGNYKFQVNIQNTAGKSSLVDFELPASGVNGMGVFRGYEGASVVQEQSFKYWRVLAEGVNSTSNFFQIAEVIFAFESGGAQLATGGTAIASSFFSGSYVAANAFDNVETTDWCSLTSVSPSVSHWIGYNFPAAVVVREVRILPSNAAVAFSSPKNMIIQGSTDGATWVTVRNLYPYSNWSGGQWSSFKVQ